MHHKNNQKHAALKTTLQRLSPGRKSDSGDVKAPKKYTQNHNVLDHFQLKNPIITEQNRFFNHTKKNLKKRQKKRCWRAAQINGPKSGYPLITKKLFPKGKRYTKEQLLSDDFTTRTSATTPLRALGGHGGGYICICLGSCAGVIYIYIYIYMAAFFSVNKTMIKVSFIHDLVDFACKTIGPPLKTIP